MNMSLTAGVIILFVLLFRQCIKRIPKVFSYVLWAVVLFRLICPVSFSSGLSLLGMLDTPTVETTERTSSIEYVPANVVYTEPHTVTVDAADTIIQEQTQPERKITIDPMTVIACVWAAGVVGMLGYSLTSYIKLRRKLIAVVPLRDNIYLADHIESAFVMGLIRPKIYLPSTLTDSEQEYIIMHEQHHIRRFDHVFKLLGFGVLCVHWFNPLVWVAFIQSGKDMEMSCDEAVIKKMGEGIRAEYSASLLSLTIGRRIIAGTPLAFSEGNTKHRIINLANWKRPKAWICIIVAISCLLFTVACGTNPENTTNPPKAEETEEAENAEESTSDSPISFIETEPVEETKEQPIKLVDDVPRPEKNVLFKTVETPYDFFSRVTKEDIDLLHLETNGYSILNDVADADKVIGILNGIKEDEILKISSVSILDMYDDIDARFELSCDDVFIQFIYKNEEIYLMFSTVSGSSLELNNPGLYGGFNWNIENEALKELFKEAGDSVGGEDGPEVIDLTEKSFTVAGEDLGKYVFRTDLQMIIVEVNGADGNEVPGSGFVIQTHGTGGSINYVETDGEDVVYEMYPVFPKYEYRLSNKDLEGCTFTLSSKDRF